MKVGMFLAALLVASASQAETDTSHHDGIKYQNLSKRPYAAPVTKAEKVDSLDEKLLEQHKHLHLHFLDRKPYAAPKNDNHNKTSS